MSIKLIQQAEVARHADGSWTHPEYPQWDESTTMDAINYWFDSQGLERGVVFFEYDAPQELQDAWSENGDSPLAKWQPTMPKGDGWFILSIHDTDDGPVCIWARPLARIVEQPARNIERSPFPSPEFRFFIFDPMDASFICYRTVEDRDSEVQDFINLYCDEAWDEQVEQLCIGEIGGVARQVNVRHRPAELGEDGCSLDESGEYWGEHEIKCDYQIAPFPPRISQAAQDVIAERRRQVEAEGFVPEQDDGYTRNELADASASYALCAGKPGSHTTIWPWGQHTFKPSADRRRDMVKSVALGIAEIERLDRAAAKAGDA